MAARKPLVLINGLWRELPSGDSIAATDVPGAVPATIFDAKGDILVGTGPDTYARRAIGNNNDPLIGDPAQSDGVRWDASRGSDLAWAREAQGLLCCNTPGIYGSAIILNSGSRTINLLLGRLPNGTSIGSIKLWTSQAMVGGTATIALFGSTSLTSNSWSRLGSNVTCTSTLQAAAGHQSITYSTSTTADQYIRAELVLSSTAPTTYPGFFVALIPLMALVNGGSSPNFINSYSSGTTTPGSTLDPTSGWTDLSAAASIPAMGLAA